MQKYYNKQMQLMQEETNNKNRLGAVVEQEYVQAYAATEPNNLQGQRQAEVFGENSAEAADCLQKLFVVITI